jgi:hypothetical protein
MDHAKKAYAKPAYAKPARPPSAASKAKKHKKPE